MNREDFIKRRLWQFFITFSIALLVLVREEVAGVLSLMTMTIVVSALAVIGWTFLMMSFAEAARKYPLQESSVAGPCDPVTRKRLLWSIRSKKFFVVTMPIFLVFGLVGTKGEPVLPRTIGIVGNLCITALFWRALFDQQKKLDQLDNNARLNKETAQGKIP